MQVTRKMVVTIEYVLKNEKGEIIDSSEKNGKLTYLHGFRNIVEGLEEALEGKKVGDFFSVSVPPEKGYGLRDENMVFTLPRENFKDDENSKVEPGMEFEVTIKDVIYILTVVEVSGDKVKVDANYPLAGKPLYFEGKVTNIRISYSDELAQGYPIKE
ncbi:MAG: peptidylprolyl isomerase [Spirochaetaceae bacterium]|nr:peptidylprolyl isomerase [Spirochaetaceae bacterium]